MTLLFKKFMLETPTMSHDSPINWKMQFKYTESKAFLSRSGQLPGGKSAKAGRFTNVA